MIYIVEYEGYENNEHKLEITGKTVSREEYDDFMENGNFDTYNSLTPNWYYKVLR